jgi:cytochrome c oxidase subunit II
MVGRSFPAVGMFLCASLIAGCSAGQTIPAVPAGLDLAKVPTTTVALTAESFHFTPDEIRVRQGTLVELAITAKGGTHGFAIAGFGIDETVQEGETKTVRFYAGEKGEIDFHCSHFCGLGHFGMNGRVVAE